MASLLDQLINEIAVLTGLTIDEVSTEFTQEQLDNLLAASKCEDEDSVAPIILNLDDISCKDDGAPSDLVKELKRVGNFPEGLEDDQKPDLDGLDNPEAPFDGGECVESVQKVNEMVSEEIKNNTEHNIILNKLYELKDNLVPLGFYYKERIKRMAKIIKAYEPILTEIKRLDAEIQKAIDNEEKEEVITELKEELTEQKAQLADTDEKYPAFLNVNFTEYQYGDIEDSKINDAIDKFITDDTIDDIDKELEKYSEYITMNVLRNRSGFNSIVSSPLINFTIKFQDLLFMSLDKEDYDIETGDKKVIKETYLIKDNPLLKKNTFFTGAPGYTISNVSSKEESEGALYTQYYNKLSDPTNEFFSLSERGLSESISHLDRNLIGSDTITKKENEKDYFIRDLKRMQTFYQEFDTIFEAKRKQVRKQVVDSTLSQTKASLEQVARMDVEMLLAIGRTNFYLPEDNANLKSVIDKINDANDKFNGIIKDLDEEIERIEKITKDTKPTPEKIKELLKKQSKKCFENMPDDPGDDPASAACSDVKEKLGSDPYFETMDGIDPTLPNFSQACYWKEFAKLANTQGLFPIPNNPSTLRYWPVGLVIPTPGGLVKIPLPQVWIPLVTISTPSGVMVIFLNINGLFISPVVFFLSASGYKQHLVTVRGSSEKFGSDKDDEIVKPLIKIPLATQAGIDVSNNGGPVDKEKALTEREKRKIERQKERKAKADAEGDIVKSHKTKKEIEGTEKQAVDRKKPATQKMKEASDKGEKVEEMVEETKKKIFANMDNLGKPSPARVLKLQEKAAKRKEKLQAEKLQAMEDGDDEKVKRINSKLKGDGLELDEKIKAFIYDTLDYFDTITFPSIVLPKEGDKLNPKEEGTDPAKDKTEEMSSSHQKEFISDDSTCVQSMISMNIAKYKGDIEDIGISGTLSVDEDLDEIKSKIKDMATKVGDKAIGKGSKPIDPDAVSAELKESKDVFDNEKDEKKKAKAKERLEKTQVRLSKKMDADRTKQTLSITPGIVSTFAGVDVSLKPFAPCCPGDTFRIGFPLPPGIATIVSQGINLVASKIDGMSKEELKAMFGGKANVGARDMRLGLLNIVQSAIPKSLKIPKPDLNLKAATGMFKGLLGGLSLPQAKFPAPLNGQQLDKKVKVNLSVVKPAIRTALKEYLEGNIEKNAQSLESDFIYSNPNDIKSFMKKFIDSQTDKISDKLSKFYSIINAPNIKNANGLDLNVMESAVFNAPPFGPQAKALFIAKGQLKFSKKKSQDQFVINDTALKVASKTMKTALQPLASNPVGYITVAGAGVTGTLNVIRKIHPILSADDIPPWERLTMKNILFLVFLDGFISMGAEQVGFFRSYL